MATTLKFTEKKFLERLLEMSGGWVLDFTNAQLRQFVEEASSVDLYTDEYARDGTSKANRLRRFWNTGSPKAVAGFLSFLIEYARTSGLEWTPSDFARCEGVVKRLLGDLPGIMPAATTGGEESEDTKYVASDALRGAATGELAKPLCSRESEGLRPTIGILTALPLEFAAMELMLDNCRSYQVPTPRGGHEDYNLGEVVGADGSPHLVVVALLPEMGNNSAAISAMTLLHHFPDVSDLIMCGIAGGVPTPEHEPQDVRLGDIVVSNRNGVVQYDLVKENPDGSEERRHPPRSPSRRLLQAVNRLQAGEELGRRPWDKHLMRVSEHRKFHRPADDVGANGIHHQYKPDSERKPGAPRVFAGTIAAANRLLKNREHRDRLASQFKVKAVEMESSGVADASWNDGAGYLVVRGVCDYCDENKGDVWQRAAAAAAAAYVRALLSCVQARGRSASLPDERASTLLRTPTPARTVSVTSRPLPVFVHAPNLFRELMRSGIAPEHITRQFLATGVKQLLELRIPEVIGTERTFSTIEFFHDGRRFKAENGYAFSDSEQTGLLARVAAESGVFIDRVDSSTSSLTRLIAQRAIKLGSEVGGAVLVSVDDTCADLVGQERDRLHVLSCNFGGESSSTLSGQLFATIDGRRDTDWLFEYSYPEFGIASLDRRKCAVLYSEADDRAMNQLRVTEGGYVYVHKLQSGSTNSMNGDKFRFETWVAGNGYAGPRSASDSDYIQKETYNLLTAWRKNLRGFIDYPPDLA